MIIDKIKKFGIKFITIPHWHNWTGLGARGGVPVTWLDRISKVHDEETSTSFLIGWIFSSYEESRQNIEADIHFVSEYLIGLSTLFIFPYEVNRLMFGNWFTGLLNTIVDIIIGLGGCLLFIVNIAFNFVNYLVRRIKAVVK